MATDRSRDPPLRAAVEGALTHHIHGTSNRITVHVGSRRLDHLDPFERVRTDHLERIRAARAGESGVGDPVTIHCNRAQVLAQAADLHIAGVTLVACGVHSGEPGDEVSRIAADAAECISGNNIFHAVRHLLQRDRLGQALALTSHAELFHGIYRSGQTDVAMVRRARGDCHSNFHRVQAGV